MAASTLLAGIGLGVLAELLVFVLLHRLLRLQGKAAGLAVGLLAILVYVPWAILTWPGADVFAIHLAIYLTVAYALGMVGGRVGRRWHWAPAIIVAFFVRYSSLASIVTAVFAPSYYLLGKGVVWEAPGVVVLSLATMGVLLVWRHAENINRLIAGKESRLGAKKP